MAQDLSRLIDVIGPLIGVFVGGLVTYWATKAVAERRWEQEKRDRRAAAERESIAKALEWLDPIDRALTTANMEVSSLLGLERDDEEFSRAFPNLLGDLARLDLSPGARILLPQGAYEEGHKIVAGLEEVHRDAIGWFQRAKLEHKPMLGLQECGKKLDAVDARTRRLREMLTEAYRDTFE